MGEPVRTVSSYQIIKVSTEERGEIVEKEEGRDVKETMTKEKES